MGARHRIRSALGALLALPLLAALIPATAAAKLPPGFHDRVVRSGLVKPTSIAVARDGTMFVAEQDGTIQRYDGPRDTTPEAAADLSDRVMSFYERGLLSIALDPGYPQRPYLYAAYTYDGDIGGDFPKWGTPGVPQDRCLPGDPDPSFDQGCRVGARVSQLTLTDGAVTNENPILEDWCAQFPSHSIGTLAFDDSGALLISGGDGAWFGGVDTGDAGDPAQRCEDPPGEGGSLRAQDALTPGDPMTLDGTIARVDPDTGAPAAGNPNPGPGNEGRVISYGFRNPYRFAIRPGTDELYIADVGWAVAEEIDRTTIDQPRDFGWPCYEGTDLTGYAPAPMCKQLDDQGGQTLPWFRYLHGRAAFKGDRCENSAGAISGLAFDSSRDFPVPYQDGLFFGDYTRGCIWSFPAARDGAPISSSGAVFENPASFPVGLFSEKDGLYYPDIVNGTIHRISFDRPTTRVKLASRPAGAKLTLAGRATEKGDSLTVERGTRYRLKAPRSFEKGSRTLVFSHWKGGGKRSHAVEPRRKGTYKAVYRAKG